MRRILTISVLALSSVTWGVAFGKGSGRTSGRVRTGHASNASLKADVANLVKARNVAAMRRKTDGDTQAQVMAARLGLSKARAGRVRKGGK